MPTGVYPKTQQHKERLSVALKGRPVAPEVLAKRIGRQQSPETVEKRAAKNRGKHYNLGHKLTAEQRAKLSAALTGRTLTAEHCLKMSVARKGRSINSGHTWTSEQKENIRRKLQGHTVTLEAREKMRQGTKARMSDPAHREQISQKLKGRTLTSEHKEKIGRRSRAAWADGRIGGADWLKKVLTGMRQRPTKPEGELTAILNQHFLGHFVYNGDFSQGVMLNHLVPDFINTNGQKQVIEVFGRMFHDPEKAWKPIRYKATAEGRIRAYETVGYHCLILWEEEFADPSAVLLKLRNFVLEGKTP